MVVFLINGKFSSTWWLSSTGFTVLWYYRDHESSGGGREWSRHTHFSPTSFFGGDRASSIPLVRTNCLSSPSCKGGWEMLLLLIVSQRQLCTKPRFAAGRGRCLSLLGSLSSSTSFLCPALTMLKSTSSYKSPVDVFMILMLQTSPAPQVLSSYYAGTSFSSALPNSLKEFSGISLFVHITYSLVYQIYSSSSTAGFLLSQRFSPCLDFQGPPCPHRGARLPAQTLSFWAPPSVCLLAVHCPVSVPTFSSVLG